MHHKQRHSPPPQIVISAAILRSRNNVADSANSCIYVFPDACFALENSRKSRVLKLYRFNACRHNYARIGNLHIQHLEGQHFGNEFNILVETESFTTSAKPGEHGSQFVK